MPQCPIQRGRVPTNSGQASPPRQVSWGPQLSSLWASGVFWSCNAPSGALAGLISTAWGHAESTIHLILLQQAVWVLPGSGHAAEGRRS